METLDGTGPRRKNKSSDARKKVLAFRERVRVASPSVQGIESPSLSLDGEKVMWVSVDNC
jgi:hypothetical protein